MCCRNQEKQECLKPKHLKGKPVECSREKIKKCHGNVKMHPCANGRSRK